MLQGNGDYHSLGERKKQKLSETNYRNRNTARKLDLLEKIKISFLQRRFSLLSSESAQLPNVGFRI